jgi:hypothetical protein
VNSSGSSLLEICYVYPHFVMTDLYFIGAPQVLRQSATPEVFVEKGQLADLSMVVCADPRPRTVRWEWGSLRLEAGSEMGKDIKIIIKFYFVSNFLFIRYNDV